MRKITIFIILISLFTTACNTTGNRFTDRSSKTSFTVIATGDSVHPINYGHLKIFKKLGKEIYRPTRHIIQRGDISFANVEGVFAKKRPKKTGYIAFANYHKDIDYMIWAGFNCFSLANNHSLDLGKKGIKNTVKIMNDREAQADPNRPILWTGIGNTKKEARRSVTKTIKGYKVTFFAYTAVYNHYGKLMNFFNLKRAVREIKEKSQSDLVIVSVHHGAEFYHVPQKYVRKTFRALIDAGADLVLGHHPHVPQGIEKRKKGLIFYSLGNFAMGTVSKRHRSRKAKLYSFIAEIQYKTVVINNKKHLSLKKVKLYPLYVDNTAPMKIKKQVLKQERFIPTVLNGVFAEEVLTSIKKWSKAIPGNNTPMIMKENYLEINFDPKD